MSILQIRNFSHFVPGYFFDLNMSSHLFLKIYVYLKNIPGILDRNDTSHISDSSSIGMFQLDETAENQPQSAYLFLKIYVYLKNIPGILDRNDTSHISDSSSIGMFQLDETAENNSYRVCWIRVPNTKTSRRAHQSQRKAPRTLCLSTCQLFFIILTFLLTSTDSGLTLFGRFIFPVVEPLPQYFQENLKSE